MYKHLLLPTDGSKLSEKAIKKGIELAKSMRAKATCVFVTPAYHTMVAEGFIMPGQGMMATRYNAESKRRAERVFDTVKKLAGYAGVACEAVHVSSDVPYEAIINTARRRKCDLIVMASHGRRGLQGLLLGSETTKVLTHSKLPVLVVR